MKIHFATFSGRRPDGGPLGLSKGQQAVFELIAEGKTNSQIQEELNLSQDALKDRIHKGTQKILGEAHNKIGPHARHAAAMKYLEAMDNPTRACHELGNEM